MKKVLIASAIFLMVWLPLTADIYVKSKIHTDPTSFMGQSQPAKDEVSETWIGSDQFATVTKEQSYVVDLKKNVFYIINHKNKTFVESTLPLDFAKLLPAEMAAMAAMFTMKATVVPTTEIKKFGQWNCKGYDVTISVMGMPMKTKIWASTEVPFNFEQFNARIFSNVLRAQLRLDEESVKEMMKIKGYQIASQTDAEIMGAKIKSNTEVLEITQKNPPADIYSTPAGYLKKDKFSTDDLQKR